MDNKRKNSACPLQWTSPLINARTTDDSVVTATTVVNGGPNARMTSRDVHIHIEKTTTEGTDAMINKLCSVLVHAMQENREKVDGVTTSSGHARSSPVTIASKGRRKSRRQFSRKTFPLSSPPPSRNKKAEHNLPSVAVQSVARYRDPIITQEVDQMDYLGNYLPEKKIRDTDARENHYEESDKPAMVWKTVEVGNPFAKNNVMYNDDEDDNDS